MLPHPQPSLPPSAPASADPTLRRWLNHDEARAFRHWTGWGLSALVAAAVSWSGSVWGLGSETRLICQSMGALCGLVAVFYGGRWAGVRRLRVQCDGVYGLPVSPSRSSLAHADVRQFASLEDGASNGWVFQEVAAVWGGQRVPRYARFQESWYEYEGLISRHDTGSGSDRCSFGRLSFVRCPVAPAAVLENGRSGTSGEPSADVQVFPAA